LPLHIIPLQNSPIIELLAIPLVLIDRLASLGGKVSNGYGVVSLVTPNREPISVGEELLGQLPAGGHSYPGMPDLRDFFFARLQFSAPPSDPDWWRRIESIQQAISDRQAETIMRGLAGKGVIPLAPEVRKWLRFNWGGSLPRRQVNFLFGTTDKTCPVCCYNPGRDGFVNGDRRDERRCSACGSSFAAQAIVERMASKINVTHAYQLPGGDWEFRIWGWIPCQAPARLGLSRDHFLGQLRTVLGAAACWSSVFGGARISPAVVEWHALNCDQRDGKAYLKTLLGLNEGGAP
jgi:hypothetical protein